jgi:hypothetical protein
MPTIPIDARGDKEERAGSVCWVANRGFVQLPQEAPWLVDFVDEVENFPLTNYKDQVDAFVHALAWEVRKGVDFKMDHLRRMLPTPSDDTPSGLWGLGSGELGVGGFDEDCALNRFFLDEPWGPGEF